MTKLGLIFIVTCLLLSIVHGYQKPRCDSQGYGQPRTASCNDLISDKISLGLRANRLFSLQTSIKPEGITPRQYQYRVALPFLQENDGCKIALLAVRFRNGSVSYDTSKWDDVRNEAQRLKRSCGAFAAAPLGGNLVVGDHSRLALILYAPGSLYDEVIQADLAAGKVIVAEEDDEPELGATTGIVKPSSLSCGGARVVLSHSTSCNKTEETVNVS